MTPEPGEISPEGINRTEGTYDQSESGMIRHRNHKSITSVFLLLTLAGCATYRTSAQMPEPRAPGENFKSYRAPEKTTVPEKRPPLLPEEGGELALDQALSLALLNNPGLATASYEILAAEKRAVQAGIYPNPEFEAELEDIGGTGELRGFNSTETTLSISQQLLLGGKRRKAMQSAALEGDLAAWDYESKRLDVITEVRDVFIRVLASQQRVELQEELVELAERLVDSIVERVDAGKVSPAELSRARVNLSATRVGLERARRELETNRRQLAATWGSRTAAFSRVVGTLDTLTAVPPLERLEPYLSLNPDLAMYEKELEQRESVIALEDAGRIPDPVVSGGFRRINESDDDSFVLAFSVPLPLSDRNQGSRQEARVQLARTRWEKEGKAVQLGAALEDIHNRLRSAYHESVTLRDRTVPEARKAFEVIREGYLMGRFDFLDVLDTQRTLFEAREQYLLALTEYHRMVAEIERMIARDLASIP